MPTFDYKCNKCNYIFEIFEITWDTEEIDTSCPECKNLDTTKLVGSPSFKLKGTGFYENDYKKKELK